MPKLYLLTLLSPNAYWIYSTLHANLPTNIHCAQAKSFDSSAFSGYRFWSRPKELSKEFQILKNAIENGKDGLLIGGSKYQERHLQLYKALREHSIDMAAKIRSIFIVSHPAALLDYYVNYCPNDWLGGKGDALAANMLKNIGKIPELIETAQFEWERQNVEIWLDFSVRPDQTSATGLVDSLYASWGYEPCRFPPDISWHKGFLGTATAIKFFLMPTGLQGNEWPLLNKENLMLSLIDFDRANSPDIGYTPEFREKHLDFLETTSRRLEELANVERGVLKAPEWHSEAPCVSDVPPSKEQFALLAKSLRSDVAHSLFRRFSIDEMALNSDQRLLLQALKEAGEFTAIEAVGETPVLTVLTMTRNHEKYIAECMDSVLAQKTDFPVRHLVLDHYSTDTTPEIIAQYASRHPTIWPVLLKKAGSDSYDNVSALFGRCHSEYAALCDGDDYFRDENKLQLQVNFLRENPQCSMVFHPVQVFFEDGSPSFTFPTENILPHGIRKEYSLADLISGNFIQTNSAVYRWRFRDGLPEWFKPRLCPGDWYWHLLHAEIGKIGFIPRVMSVYRRHPKALFGNSFKDSKKHRRQFGTKELEAYNEINAHFRGRFSNELGVMASGVLADLMQACMDMDDMAPFDEAILNYPEFGLYFLNNLNQDLIGPRTAAISDKG